MKRKAWLLFSGVVVLILASFATRDIQSNGAPIGSSGAPGEFTCAKSTCHADNAINSGAALLSLSGGPQFYEAGRTYDLTVTLTDSLISRFGFQVTALYDADDTQAGTFHVTDSTRTQLLPGQLQFTGRDYMTYLYPGTDPFQPGVGQWSFKWTAPVDGGDVNFYVAGVAANNDGTDYGDIVYLKQYTVYKSITGIEEHGSFSFNLYPNPASKVLHLEFPADVTGELDLTIYNIVSQQTYRQQLHLSGLERSVDVDLTEGFGPGIYLVSVGNPGGRQVRKLIIE